MPVRCVCVNWNYFTAVSTIFFKSQQAKLRAIQHNDWLSIQISTIKYAYSSNGVQKCKSKLFNFGHQTHFTRCTIEIVGRIPSSAHLLSFVISCFAFIEKKNIICTLNVFLLHDIHFILY